MKLVHKDLRFFFFLYENRIEILLCHKCVCIQIPWTVLCFYLRIELFFFIHLPSHFFIEPWYEVHLLASCYHVGCHCRPTPSAYQPCWRTWFLLALSSPTSHPVFDGSVLSGAPTRLICFFSFYWCVCLLLMLFVWSVRGSERRARESMHSGDLRAVNRLDMPYASSQGTDLCVPSSTSWYHELLEGRVRGLSVLRSWKISEI